MQNIRGSETPKPLRDFPLQSKVRAKLWCTERPRLDNPPLQLKLMPQFSKSTPQTHNPRHASKQYLPRYTYEDIDYDSK